MDTNAATDTMATEVIIGLAGSNALTALLTHLLTRRGRQAATESAIVEAAHEAVETVRSAMEEQGKQIDTLAAGLKACEVREERWEAQHAELKAEMAQLRTELWRYRSRAM